MGTLIKLLFLSVMVILVGTFLMYLVEGDEPNSEIDSLEDALWWCIATVTTVGYGDIVPVSKIGRIVAMAYMGFGISMIAILMSTITNNFYRKRIESVDRRKEREEREYFRKEVINRLDELEKNNRDTLICLIKKKNLENPWNNKIKDHCFWFELYLLICKYDSTMFEFFLYYHLFWSIKKLKILFNAKSRVKRCID